MGVELNFLSKKKSRWNASRLLIAASVLVFLLGAGSLWLQHSAVAPVSAQQPAIEPVDPLQFVATELAGVERDAVPYVTLYQAIADALGETATLQTFDYAAGTPLQLNVSTDSLEAVGRITVQLERLPYVLSVSTGDVEQPETGTTAALIIEIDEIGLRSLGKEGEKSQ